MARSMVIRDDRDNSSSVERCFELESRPSREGRSELLESIAQMLSEICAPASDDGSGNYSYLVLDTIAAHRAIYVQFLMDADLGELLTEVSSGFYANPAAHIPTDNQRAEMVKLGYQDGLEGNFEKTFARNGQTAHALAQDTLSLLGNVFGWVSGTPFRAKVGHDRRSRQGRRKS